MRLDAIRIAVGILLMAAAAMYALHLLYWQTCDWELQFGDARICVRTHQDDFIDRLRKLFR
jgi:hypothetical protein